MKKIALICLFWGFTSCENNAEIFVRSHDMQAGDMHRVTDLKVTKDLNKDHRDLKIDRIGSDAGMDANINDARADMKSSVNPAAIFVSLLGDDSNDGRVYAL